MTMQQDTLALLPEILMLIGAVVTLLAGSFLPRRRQALAGYIAIAALAGTAVAAGVGLLGSAATIFEGSFAVDDATGLARLIIPLATILVLVLALTELRGTPRESETYALMLLAALGAMMMAGASDLMVLAAGYLLASIPLYALVGMSRAAGAAEAALKTYLLGALLGIALLAGVTILYGVGGSTSYRMLETGLAQAPVAAVAAGIIGVLAGLMFKAGGVPGHFWVPDATQASATSVAAFLTTIPKIGAIVAAYRLFDVIPGSVDWPLLVGLVAAVTMTLGNFAAFGQNDVRRLLGWSTVSQVGYLLLPVAVAGRAELALPSMMLYLAGYAVTNLTAFAVVGAVRERRTISDYRGVAASDPLLAVALVVSLLGLVGTPPTVVFVGKLTTFTAAWDGGLAWLVVVAAINTVASLFYYLRWLAPMFSREQARDDSASPPAVGESRNGAERIRAVRSPLTAAPMGVSLAGVSLAGAALTGAVATIVLGVFSGAILSMVSEGVVR